MDQFLIGVHEVSSLPDPPRWWEASTLWVYGSTIRKVLDDNKRWFRGETSTYFRFLMVDPDVMALRGQLLMPGAKRTLPDQIHLMYATLQRLWALQQTLGADRVRVKVLRCVPPFTLIIRDAELATGIIQVSLNLFETDLAEKPLFHLRADRDKRWYPVLLRQFKLLWERDEAVELAREKAFGA